jgi:S-methylmethionine-dependent homocysteine/selenocysteine methylase
MSKYRNDLPQLTSNLCVTDGGLETTLIFNHGYDLPEFAAFDLLSRPGGYEVLQDYYLPYIEVARQHRADFILESCTWRASPNWGRKLGYTTRELRDINQQAIAMLENIRRRYENDTTRMVISGCIGPQGDGYHPATQLTAQAAEDYHRPQIETLANTGIDLVSAFTINASAEAVGIVRAAQKPLIGKPATALPII